MAEKFDPKNPAHKALADLIKAKRDSLKPEEKQALANELNGSQRMGVIKKILGK